MSTLRTCPLASYLGGLALCLFYLAHTTLAGPLTAMAQTIPTANCASNRVLLVVSSLNLEPRDATFVAHLVAQNFLVDLKTGKEVTAADADGKGLVIISESVTSDDVNNKLRDVAVPILTWEGWLYDNLRMTGTKTNQDYGELQPETQIRIVNPNHPLAAGLAGDVHLLNSVSSAEERKLHWGVPSSGATIVANYRREPNNAHIFAYEKGATMVGLVAPARRVGFPNGSAHRFTAEGWRLFDAAVAWAMACANSPTATATLADPSTPIPTGTFIPTTPPTVPATTQTPTTVATVATATATKRPPPSATPTVTPTPGGEARLGVTKVDFLYHDADQNDLVSAGDTMLYAIKINNFGGKAAYQIRLVDPPDPNSTLLVGTVTTDMGTVVKGNVAGDAHVVIEVPELASGARVLISLQVQVNAQVSQASLQNQAITTFVDQIPEPRSQTTVVSDDPDTPNDLDTTVTVLNAPLAQLNRKLFMPIMAR